MAGHCNGRNGIPEGLSCWPEPAEMYLDLSRIIVAASAAGSCRLNENWQTDGGRSRSSAGEHDSCSLWPH
jgi:hypothetical protein